MGDGCLSMLEMLGLVLGLICRQICGLCKSLNERGMFVYVGDVGTSFGPHS